LHLTVPGWRLPSQFRNGRFELFPIAGELQRGVSGKRVDCRVIALGEVAFEVTHRGVAKIRHGGEPDVQIIE